METIEQIKQEKDKLQERLNNAANFFREQKAKIEALTKENEELQKMRNCHYSPLLSIDDREKVSYYQKFLLSYLQEKTRNYQSSHEIYRKFDILFLILKANGGHL